MGVGYSAGRMQGEYFWEADKIRYPEYWCFIKGWGGFAFLLKVRYTGTVKGCLQWLETLGQHPKIRVLGVSEQAFLQIKNKQNIFSSIHNKIEKRKYHAR